MGTMASQITSLTIVYWTVYSSANQRKHKSSASLAFVRGIHRWPVNSPHKGPVMRKMLLFDDVIMTWINTSRPNQNGRHFAEDIIICSFLNENFDILIQISLKFFSKCPIDSMPLLLNQVVDWRKAVFSINDDFLSIGASETSLELESNKYVFFQEHAFGNVVCKMTTTLAWSQCVLKTYISVLLHDKHGMAW